MRWWRSATTPWWCDTTRWSRGTTRGSAATVAEACHAGWSAPPAWWRGATRTGDSYFRTRTVSRNEEGATGSAAARSASIARRAARVRGCHDEKRVMSSMRVARIRDRDCAHSCNMEAAPARKWRAVERARIESRIRRTRLEPCLTTHNEDGARARAVSSLRPCEFRSGTGARAR